MICLLVVYFQFLHLTPRRISMLITVIYRTERLCASDTRIGDIDIPKGMAVQIPIYAIHHDPKIWPEPEKFDPYRFTSEEKAKHGPYDWIPFGSGPRNCVAMRLAQVELKIGVAYLIRAFKFVRCDKTEVSCAGTDQIKIIPSDLLITFYSKLILYI